MKRINESRKAEIQSIIKGNSEQITSVLKNLVEDKWTDLGTPENTVKRLKRKGYRNSAQQFMEYYEQIKRATSDNKPDPSATELPVSEKNINSLIKEGISGSNQMISSNFLHKGSRVARCVARIIEEDSKEALGSGFMVSPSLFMTNNHVLPDIAEAQNSIIEFNFVSNGSDNPIEAVRYKLDPNKFFLTSDENEFDYTIVAVESFSKNGFAVKDFGWIRLIEDVGKAAVGERLNIIHHPSGQPQQASIRENLLISHDESPMRLFYMTDTEHGSSGSPVLNDDWELVALHYASIEIDNDNQKELFLQHMYNAYKNLVPKDNNKTVRLNVGMRISAIVNNIKMKKNGLGANEQEVLKELFNSLIPSDTHNFNMNFREQELVSGNWGGRKENNELIPPINLSINIGNRDVGHPYLNSDSKNTSKSINTIGNLKTKLELYNSKLNSQKSVFKALTFLDAARNSTYLPHETVIANRRKEYYDSIIEDVNSGISKADLYDNLNGLLSSTLQLATKYPDPLKDIDKLFERESLKNVSLEGGIKYARARAHLYTWVDLRQDRMLRGVYTNLIIPPEQLLLKDLISTLDLEIELPQRLRNNQFLNCEHIVPQSLFGKDALGVSDLHHLITAEGATNNFRSDSPYRELGENGKEGPAGLPDYIVLGGKKHNGFFEPKRNKGLVARATLYFLVAHKAKISSAVYDEKAIKTLIEWSNMEKPDKYELHRNESIFEIQKNRNPFIDFPSWVEKVDFKKGVLH